jgi:hypothetical protein
MWSSPDDEESRAIWLAGEEVGRREERARIINLLDSLVCDKVFCKDAKIVQVHPRCKAAREHIQLIQRGTDEQGKR